MLLCDKLWLDLEWSTRLLSVFLVDLEMLVSEFQENSCWMVRFDECRIELQVLVVFQKQDVMKKLKFQI
jgi:hypothetical protein